MYIINILIVFLPSKIKIMCYRAMGSKIGNNCYIGFSIVNAKSIEIENCVYIGHFNLLKSLKTLKLETGSKINKLNWITGAGTGSFFLGRNSVLTFSHYLDASSDIKIGNNCVIAGRYSQFFTHGITPALINRIDNRPITIGDWCYIGTNVSFVPGASISDHTFVGMGAVVTKKFTDNYVLIAGNPAGVKKNLSSEADFFNRSHLPHIHHPSSYLG